MNTTLFSTMNSTNDNKTSNWIRQWIRQQQQQQDKLSFWIWQWKRQKQQQQNYKLILTKKMKCWFYVFVVICRIHCWKQCRIHKNDNKTTTTRTMDTLHISFFPRDREAIFRLGFACSLPKYLSIYSPLLNERIGLFSLTFYS